MKDTKQAALPTTTNTTTTEALRSYEAPVLTVLGDLAYTLAESVPGGARFGFDPFSSDLDGF